MVRKKKKTVDSSTIVMILLSIIITIAIIMNPDIISIIFKKPFVTVQTLPTTEPLDTDSCRKLNGLLINPDQDCIKGYINWGYGLIGTEKRVCCIPDLCAVTGGKYETLYTESNKRFERRCVCPYPSIYMLMSGCTIQYQ